MSKSKAEKAVERRKIDCSTVRENLAAHVAGELGENMSKLIGEHLRECQQCRGEAAEIMLAISALRGADPASGAPEKLSEKSFRRIMWLYDHPFWAFVYKWHRLVSLIVALAVIGSLVYALYQWKWKPREIPDGIPVEIVNEIKD